MGKRLLVSVLFAFAFSSPSQAALIEQTLEVARVDGSPVQILVSRPSTTGKIPMVLAIAGSVCIPSRLGMEQLSPEISGLGPYALVFVEKPGPTQPPKGADGSYSIGPDFQCSDTFKKYYTIDQRVTDHLRAIQYLRGKADWWDGRLFVWGFSDGARIASRVGAFTPETQRMVLGGFGGGLSMAAEFEEFHICPAGTKDRDSCLKNLRAQFQEIRDNPTPQRTWNGDSNTWAAWASRLDAVEANILKDITFPVLVFHGTKDKSVPVASARQLAQQLAVRGSQFVYREIEGMGHGLGSDLPPAKGEELQREFLAWLLGSSSPSPLVLGETFTIESKILSETRRINVYLPPAYSASPDARLPVLYMPDGGMAEDFQHVAGLLQISSANGTMRAFLLVGIENTQRRRDLTGPTENEEDKKIAPRVGGSEAFRAFVRQELMPRVKARYRTTEETAIVGESLAGLFVVETFFLEPDLFDTYIALDPSLWWNNQKLVNGAEEILRTRPDLKKTLYLANSDEPGIAKVTQQLAAILARSAPPGLHWHHEAMPEEKHWTIYHPAAIKAFRAVFKP